MAYVNIPKDLNKIKPRVLLGLTRQQLIGFGTGAILGGITFFTTKVSVGETIAILLLMLITMPCILYGIYEPPGLSVEQQALAMMQFWFASNGLRPYQTENIYSVIQNKGETEVKRFGKTSRQKSAGKKT